MALLPRRRCRSPGSTGRGPVGARRRKGDRTEPFGDGPPLGSRICEAVGHHREHRVGGHPRSPAVAERREVLVEAQATEVGPDSRCGTEARRALAGQLSSLEPVPLRVGTKRPDDPVYLPARAQLGDLAEAQERAVGVAAILPDGLDERKVLVRPLDIGAYATAWDWCTPSGSWCVAPCRPPECRYPDRSHQWR